MSQYTMSTFNQSRIVKKPWGQEEIWAECNSYLGKIITIHPGHRLSRQFHEHKEETIRVLSGRLTLETGPTEGFETNDLTDGHVFHVSPGTIHRFCNYQDDVDVVLLEVSTSHLDDVVRLEDDYRR